MQYLAKSAAISLCGRYRYRLTRRMLAGNKNCCFIMLNPSIADALRDDPTIRRCVQFAMRENCDGLYVVNLFALRSTDPKVLNKANKPIGFHNDRYILETAKASKLVIAGWGSSGTLHNRDREVLLMLEKANITVYSLGELTLAGCPKHPLRLRGDTPLLPYKGRDF